MPSPFRVAAEATIYAPPQAVWTCLTDPTCLQNGTGLLRLEGKPAPNARLKLWSEVSPKRAFSLRVTAFEPTQRMVWTGGMPFGLFTGQRSFELSPTPDGCQLTMQEVFRGSMAGLIWKSMPDLNPSFDKFIRAIKTQAEQDY